MPAAKRCITNGSPSCRCGDPAKLQCPKCLDLKMPKHASAFCSQDCFKAGWAEHKSLHKANADSYMYVLDSGRSRSLRIPSWTWTGPLQPERYAHPAVSLPGSRVRGRSLLGSRRSIAVHDEMPLRSRASLVSCDWQARTAEHA